MNIYNIVVMIAIMNKIIEEIKCGFGTLIFRTNNNPVNPVVIFIICMNTFSFITYDNKYTNGKIIAAIVTGKPV